MHYFTKMVRIFPFEEFKEIELDDSLKFRYAISNYGRLISFNKRFEDGRLLKGGMLEGYKIFRYRINNNGKFIYKHKFFYRLVAENFLEKESDEHTHILHLNYIKTNDSAYNLKWATLSEKMEHHKENPNILRAREKQKIQNKNRDGHKLTITQVMLLKKRLANPKNKTRMKILARQFGISEMQLHRIKTGENWGHVKVEI